MFKKSNNVSNTSHDLYSTRGEKINLVISRTRSTPDKQYHERMSTLKDSSRHHFIFQPIYLYIQRVSSILVLQHNLEKVEDGACHEW